MILRATSLGILSLILVGAWGSSADRRSFGQPTYRDGYILHRGEGEILQRGGRDDRLVIKVDETKTGSPQMAMGIQTVTEAIPVHRHEQEEEFLFVHKGHGLGVLGNESVTVEEGATIYIPPGTWHGFENADEQGSEILWVVTPGYGEETQLEKYFRATGVPPGEEPKVLTPARLNDVRKKHGVTPRQK